MINIHMYEVMGVALSIVIVLKVGVDAALIINEWVVSAMNIDEDMIVDELIVLVGDGLIAVMNNSKLLEVGDSVGVTTVRLFDWGVPIIMYNYVHQHIMYHVHVVVSTH